MIDFRMIDGNDRWSTVIFNFRMIDFGSLLSSAVIKEWSAVIKEWSTVIKEWSMIDLERISAESETHGWNDDNTPTNLIKRGA